MSTSAFPSPGVVLVANSQQQGAYEGMTLRDYFAAKAIGALLSQPGGISITPHLFARESGVAYALADAMLKARDA